MYMNFYKLERSPFNITPDPEFLFLSSVHKEALGAIIYCVSRRKGFVSVVGEVGTGKTTIIRSYLAKCDRRKVKPIYIFNPSVTFVELLQTIFQELGLTPPSERVSDMVRQLHLYLIGEYERGRNLVLMVDEAQNMPVSTFEQLRILSNLETAKDKLLQIVLVGQPELQEKLASRVLRQLNQRLAVRATLRPLSPRESRAYVLFRLAKVTSTPKAIFTEAALKKIVKAAKGSPRMLNILCDNALVAGFGNLEKRITGKMAGQVIADFEGRELRRFLTWKHAFLFGIFMLFFFALSEIRPFPSFARFGFGQWGQFPANTGNSLVQTVTPPAPAGQAPGIKPSASASLDAGQVADPRIGETAPLSAPQAEKGAGRQVPKSMPPASTNQRAVLAASPTSVKGEVAAKTRTVRAGESLYRICLEKYGFVNNRVIAAVRNLNPNIRNADLIYSGARIVLPEITESDATLADSRGR